MQTFVCNASDGDLNRTPEAIKVQRRQLLNAGASILTAQLLSHEMTGHARAASITPLETTELGKTGVKPLL